MYQSYILFYRAINMSCVNPILSFFFVKNKVASVKMKLISNILVLSPLKSSVPGYVGWSTGNRSCIKTLHNEKLFHLKNIQKGSVLLSFFSIYVISYLVEVIWCTSETNSYERREKLNTFILSTYDRKLVLCTTNVSIITRLSSVTTIYWTEHTRG